MSGIKIEVKIETKTKTTHTADITGSMLRAILRTLPGFESLPSSCAGTRARPEIGIDCGAYDLDDYPIRVTWTTVEEETEAGR